MRSCIMPEVGLPEEQPYGNLEDLLIFPRLIYAYLLLVSHALFGFRRASSQIPFARAACLSPQQGATAMPHSLPSRLKAILSDARTRADIDDYLESARQELGMDIAYLSEIVGKSLVFRAVRSPGIESIIQTSNSLDLRETYCKYVLDGSLPPMIVDTAAHQIAVDLPVTQIIPIRSHVSVPLTLADGSVFDMVCCLARDVRSDLPATRPST